jgi:dihydrofolate synthase/folylpolyglutamate synthase
LIYGKATRVRYAQAIARLFALQSRGVRMGASRMRAALALRGHPEHGQRFVHVAGTNGKGSVSAMLAACFTEAGYRTGLYTSPHLHRFVERIRIDGRPLGEAEAARRITELLAAFAHQDATGNTFFELTTLLALEVFRDRACDVVVLEVGLGGRLDATNAVTPVASVITRIALDHTRILGDSIRAIAREKAGIIKAGVPLVTAVREPEARAVIEGRARRLGVDVMRIDRDFAVLPARHSRRFDVRVRNRRLLDLKTSLPGLHQRDNAACAIAVLDRLRDVGIDVPEAAMRRGLARVRWPGRLERVGTGPAFVLDAAHNLDGCQALVRFLIDDDRWRAGRGGRRVLVFGAMVDKDYPAMLRLLAPLVDKVIYCPPAISSAATHAQLARIAPGARARGVADALARARRSAGPRGQVIVTGSIYLIAPARARLLGLRADPLIRM